MNWFEADDYCSHLTPGAGLAEITNNFTQMLLSGAILNFKYHFDKFWIGGYTDNIENIAVNFCTKRYTNFMYDKIVTKCAFNFDRIGLLVGTDPELVLNQEKVILLILIQHGLKESGEIMMPF